MNQRVLISGSIAYDTIMVFDGHFKDHILPDRTHMLSVSFLVPRLTRQYGGTGANIAYNVSMLGGDAAVLATVGRDGDEYVARLVDMGIDTQAVRRLDAHWTAQCFITTDLANNQLIAFHPGAMDDAHAVGLTDARPAALGIVSPNGKQAMLDHARQFEQAGMRWIFDPGQGLPMFDGDELRDLIGHASAVAVNDYECAMLVQKTGWDEARIAASLQALIVTRGAQGSVVWTDGQPHAVAAAPIAEAVDPTGCGDAYRGGLLYGLSRGLGWVASARIGSVLGAIKIERSGAQNHRASVEDVVQRHRQAYGELPW